jgi:ABC-type branched-subunit amino acid transport system permease subunit
MSKDKIGKDEWVASYQQRSAELEGWSGTLAGISTRLPTWAWFLLIIAIGFVIPLLTDNTFVIRVAGNIALMAILAMGLNLVVGYAGLLDLGFVAFYGIGGYIYAYLSSDFTGIHLPTWLTLIIVMGIGALFGLLLGSPSLRLVGDYLAIVTLGFGQIFVQLMTSLTRVNVPGQEKPVNLTGGPNGIVNLDPFSIFGFTASGVTDYYYVLLVVMVIILLICFHLNNSRVGRAWRSLREDELAADAMGMPTRQLKLLAFALGAAIAGLSGALFAAWQGAVFPGNFDIALLINIYAIIVLGGLGSLPGVIVGAILMIAIPEILRNAELAGQLFYLLIIITLVATLRPRWQSLAVLVSVIVFGIILKPILIALSPNSFAALEATGSGFVDAVRNWLAIPIEAKSVGNLAFVALILMVLLVTRLKGMRVRFIALIPTLYLLSFVWETRLSQEPSITRLLFVGVLLIVLMIYRPNGLLGQRRVEVV